MEGKADRVARVYLHDRRKWGKRAHPLGSKAVTGWISGDLAEKLFVYAEGNHITVSNAIEQAIRQFVK
ncbi:hypothetical protein ES708_02382 [subsurface metagenome]